MLLLTGAALGDRFGRRRMFALGLGIFTAASAAAALAPSIEVLNVARAVQGVGGAIVMPLTLTILSAAVPAERRGVALGAWGGISGLAVAFGPLVGGAVVSGISWHWIFWLNVPIGLVLLPLALSRLEETRGPAQRFDLPGLGLVERRACSGSSGASCAANAVGWTSPQIVGSLVAGAVLTAAFVAWELRDGAPDAADALLPQPHVRAREHRVAADELRDVRLDLPAGAVLPDRAGLLAAAVGAADPAVDGDADDRRPDRRRALGPDRRAQAHGHRASPCRRSASPGSRPSTSAGVSYVDLVAPFTISGIGMGLFFAPVANVVLSSVRPTEEGQASGANSAIRELGGVFGVAVLASVFTHYGSYASPATFSDGMVPAVWIGAVVVAAGSIAAFAIKRSRREEAAAQDVALELAA